MTDVPNQDPWLARLRGGEVEREAAIAELREIILRGLSKSLSQRYGTGIQPEDVVQDALIKILNSLDQFEGRSRFTTWALTIATRVGISALRRRHFKDVSLDAFANNEQGPLELAVDTGESPGDNLDRNSVLQMLGTFIDTRLTEKQRVAIRALLEGLPVEEIADRLGSNRNAVYKLIHDARLRLKESFDQAGFVVEDLAAVFA